MHRSESNVCEPDALSDQTTYELVVQNRRLRRENRELKQHIVALTEMALRACMETERPH
ncbi:MAG TPA: hypothetical protein VNQ99_10855 [Xanthobacteraceae bacterium]|nr:hypothetical protein [Xanthobacteraceae bacterium]